jgi:hypothetical protein
MALTEEVMEQEAQAVAEGIADIIQAGVDKSASTSEKIAVLVARGYATFGDIDAGLDDDANKARFALEVVAKTTDILVSRLLPLTESTEE